MSATLDVVRGYYEALQGGKELSEVPMRKDLTFKGAIRSVDGAEEYRTVLAELVPQVKSLDIRRQISDGEFVITIYDLDFGNGPIPMAECVRVVSGELVEIELLFDSARMQPGK